MPSSISRLYTAFVLLLTLIIAGYAVEATFSVKGGGTTYFGEIHDNQIRPYSALSADLWLHRTFAFQAAVLYGHLRAEKNDE